MRRLGVIGAGLVSASAFGQPATFTLLRNPTFPFIGMDSPRAMSANGKVVVGNYGTRWTLENGVVPTGFVPGTQTIRLASAVNIDGSVEVGSPLSLPGRYWTLGTSTTFYPGEPYVSNIGLFGPCLMTDDGQWFLGYAYAVPRPARVNRDATFELFPIGVFDRVSASSMSSDGAVVVGTGQRSGLVSGQFGIAWIIETGSASSAAMVTIEDFLPVAVSGDGRIAAGQLGSSAAVWTIGAGVEVFGPPLGFTSASSSSISNDGQVVVGSAGGPIGSTVYVRRTGEQARDLRVVLARFGVDSPELTYSVLYPNGAAISRDAQVVCGTAVSPWYGTWAFVATIPHWEPCPSDLNFDGFVDDADFGIFASAYDRLSTTDGDLNVDRFTDDADFSMFAVAYDVLLCP